MTLDKWQGEAAGGGGQGTCGVGIVSWKGGVGRQVKVTLRSRARTWMNEATWREASRAGSLKQFELEVSAQPLGQHANVLQSTVAAGFPSMNSTKEKKKELDP